MAVTSTMTCKIGLGGPIAEAKNLDFFQIKYLIALDPQILELKKSFKSDLRLPRY